MTPTTQEATQAAALHKHVSDMVALVDHILEAVETQLGWEEIQRLPEARQRLEQTLAVLRAQKLKLESYLAGTGEDASLLKKAVTTITGMAAGLYGKVREHTGSRILRDDYTALNLASVSYTMLHTTALTYGERVLADLAALHFKELATLIVGLADALPEIVAREIEGADADRVGIAIAATHDLNRKVWDGVLG
jgi:hypothetical protein